MGFRHSYPQILWITGVSPYPIINFNQELTDYRDLTGKVRRESFN